MVAKKRMNMTTEHKEALAQGRSDGHVVGKYLEALHAAKPRRGRRRSKEATAKRLVEIEKRLIDATPLQIIQLVQERIDLQREQAALADGGALPKLEKDFIRVAKNYAERKGLSYAAWREGGVPPEVLQKAGITRN